MNIKELVKRFVKDEDGLAIFEYILILGVIAVLVLFLSPSIRNAIANWFSNLMGNIDSGLDNDEIEYTCPDGRTVQDMSMC